MKLKLKFLAPNLEEFLDEVTPEDKSKTLNAFYEFVHSGQKRGPDYIVVSLDTNNKTMEILKPAKPKI